MMQVILSLLPDQLNKHIKMDIEILLMKAEQVDLTADPFTKAGVLGTMSRRSTRAHEQDFKKRRET